MVVGLLNLKKKLINYIHHNKLELSSKNKSSLRNFVVYLGGMQGKGCDLLSRIYKESF